jgi:hypothetical protein
MPAQLFDLVDDLSQTPPKRDAIEQGADFGWVVQFQAADTDATAAEDWAARMQVRRALADKDTGEPLLDLDTGELGGVTVSVVEDAEGDLVRLDITATAATTATLPVGKWWYDVELVRVADGYVRRIAKGRAQVTGEVTR